MEDKVTKTAMNFCGLVYSCDGHDCNCNCPKLEIIQVVVFIYSTPRNDFANFAMTTLQAISRGGTV
eukprot:2825630-Amphidinium_carterae.1